MKCDIFHFLVDMSKREELNLEELIKFVSIGKTSVDDSSGKFNISINHSETSYSSSDVSKSFEGDFDPLSLQVSNISHSTDIHCQSLEKLKNDTNVSATICSNKRLKRKRRLFDADSHCFVKMNDKANGNNKTEEIFKNNSSAITDKDDHDTTSSQSLTKPINFHSKLIVQLSSCKEESSQDSTINQNSNVCLPNLEDLTLHENCLMFNNTPLAQKFPTEVNGTITCFNDKNQSCSDFRSEVDTTFTDKDKQNYQTVSKKRKSENLCESETRSLRKRIRKILPPVKARQTPMGLPKPLRIKKDKFSLEEIYTNKNYCTPVPKHLETIFEYPKEDKDGTVRYSEKKRKQRAMYFCTDPSNRPSKKKSKYKKRATRRNKRDNDGESDTKLLQALSDLDTQLLLSNVSP